MSLVKSALTLVVCLLSVVLLSTSVFQDDEFVVASAEDVKDVHKARTEAEAITSLEMAGLPALLKPKDYSPTRAISHDETTPFEIPGSEVFVEFVPATLAGEGTVVARIWLGDSVGWLRVQIVPGSLDLAQNAAYQLFTAGDGVGSMTVTSDGRLLGSIWINGRFFEIEPLPEAGMHRVVELESDQWDRIGYSAVPVHEKGKTQAAVETKSKKEAGKNQTSRIDVLALYSPVLEKRIVKRSDATIGVTSAISDVVTAANGMLTRSKVEAELRLVGVMPIDVTEDRYQDDASLLRYLQTGGKEFKKVDQYRASTGADIVVLFLPGKESTDGDSGEKCLATAFRPMSADDLKAENGFAVVRYRKSGHEAGISFARAFASLLGVAGSYYTDNTDERKPFIRAAWGYHIGEQDTYPFGKAGHRGTLMTSARSILPYYSSPTISVQGEQIGKWWQQVDDAYAVHAMNRVAVVVSSYRHDVPNGAAYAVSMQGAESGYYTFTFRDPQGAQDIRTAELKFKINNQNLIMFFKYDSYSRKCFIHFYQAVLTENNSISLFTDNNSSLNSQDVIATNIGMDIKLRLPVKFGVATELDEVWGRAIDIAGASMGWTNLGSLGQVTFTEERSEIAPSSNPELKTRLQLLINKGKSFYTGLDVYGGMYEYDNENLEYYIKKTRNAGMNYIRLILQANVWLATQKIASEKSIIKYDTSDNKYNLTVTQGNISNRGPIDEDGARWSEFISAIKNNNNITSNNGNEIALHIDVYDNVQFNHNNFQFSEYCNLNNKNTNGQIDSSGDGGAPAGTRSRQHFNDCIKGTLPNSDVIRGEYFDVIGKIRNAMSSYSVTTNGVTSEVILNTHLIGDGNEIPNTEFKVNGVTGILNSKLSINDGKFEGRVVIGNAALWGENDYLPDYNGDILSNKIIAIHHTQKDSGYKRYDYRRRYDLYKGKKYFEGDNDVRLLFSTDGTSEGNLYGTDGASRPSFAQLRVLYYDLLSDNNIDIRNLAGLGDIKIDRKALLQSYGMNQNKNTIEYMTDYWGKYVNKPPYIKNAINIDFQEVKNKKTCNKYTLTIRDENGNGTKQSIKDGTFKELEIWFSTADNVDDVVNQVPSKRVGVKFVREGTGVKYALNNGQTFGALQELSTVLNNGVMQIYDAYVNDGVYDKELEINMLIKQKKSKYFDESKPIFVKITDQALTSVDPTIVNDFQNYNIDDSYYQGTYKTCNWTTDYINMKNGGVKGNFDDNIAGFPKPISISLHEPQSIIVNIVASYSDPDKDNNIKEMYIGISDESEMPNREMSIKYDTTTNLLYLSNDDDTDYPPSQSAEPGQNVYLENGLVRVHVLHAVIEPASGTDNERSMTIRVEAIGPFREDSVKNVELGVSDMQGHMKGMVYFADWKTDMKPSTKSVTPSAGNGENQVFTVVYKDPLGAADIGSAEINISADGSEGNSVSILLDRTVNPATVNLRNDAGSAWLSSPVGTPGSRLENSQCVIDVANTTVGTNGNDLILAVPVEFKSSYGGVKNVYTGVSSISSGESEDLHRVTSFDVTWSGIKVLVEPADARSSARWRLDNEPALHQHDEEVLVKGSEDHQIQFQPVSGRPTPPDRYFAAGTIQSGTTRAVTGYYSEGSFYVDFKLSPQTDTDGLSQQVLDSMNAEVSANGQFRVFDADTGDPVQVDVNGTLQTIVTGENISSGYRLPAGNYTIEVVKYNPNRYASARDEGFVYGVCIEDGRRIDLELYYLPVGSVTVILNNALWRTDGARWRQLRPGLPVSEWFESGYTDIMEPIGDYNIEINAVSGWDTQSLYATIQVQHGTNNMYTRNPTLSNGQVRVTFNPAPDGYEAGWYNRRWSVTGGGSNLTNNATTNAAVGYQTISFSVAGGFQTPGNVQAQVRPLTLFTHTQGFNPASGSIKGYIFPNGARNAGCTWKIKDGDNIARVHQEVVSATGPKRKIGFTQASGWTAPPDFHMPVKQGQTTHTTDYGSATFNPSALSSGITRQADDGVEKPDNLQNGYYIRMLTVGTIKVDFDGDGKADMAAFDPATGDWLVYGKGVIATLGGQDTWPVPGDYNGDKKTDIAVYYFDTGVWEIPGIGKYELGEEGDSPIPGDYNGDGVTDLAVYSPKTGILTIHYLIDKALSKDVSTVQTGTTAFPFSGDFDGDGKDDIVAYDSGKGSWLQDSKLTAQGGEEDDVTLVADLDGDKKTDVVFFRPEEGIWIVNGAKEKAVQFGQMGDVPIPADYDGDGVIEYAVYRPSTGSILISGHKEAYPFDRLGLIPLAGGR